jgi:hypothetical protein
MLKLSKKMAKDLSFGSPDFFLDSMTLKAGTEW